MGESGRSRWSDSAGADPVTYLAWRFLKGTLGSVEQSLSSGWLQETDPETVAAAAALMMEVRTTGEGVGGGPAAGTLL